MMLFLGALLGVFLASLFLTKFLIGWLTKRQVIDVPNQRSSHKTITPRGGGLAILLVFLPFVILWPLVEGTLNFYLYHFLLPIIGLAIVSGVDDVKGLSAQVRISFHILAVGVGLFPYASYLQNHPLFLPAFILIPAFFIAWLWFINLYNFMDGIDGITGIETIFICIGCLLFAPKTVAALAVFLLLATLGFLRWNWSPAKIFLGDVGSVTLGFILGAFLLEIALSSHWAYALILPLYYLADATITLVRRGLQGKKIWQAHKEHFYQRAVQNGCSHRHVALCVALCNIGLLICAYFVEVWGPYTALIAAGLVVAATLGYFARVKKS